MAKKATDRQIRSRILKALAPQPCSWRDGLYRPRLNLTELTKLIEGASRARVEKQVNRLEKDLKVISGHGLRCSIVWYIPDDMEVARVKAKKARGERIKKAKARLARAIKEPGAPDELYYHGCIRLSLEEVEKILELLEKK